MKKSLRVLLLGLIICGGCATRYTITLTSGEVITTRGKPVYDPDRVAYIYKDDSGRTNAVFASKVREVAPTSMAEKGNSQFISK